MRVCDRERTSVVELVDGLRENEKEKKKEHAQKNKKGEECGVLL